MIQKSVWIDPASGKQMDLEEYIDDSPWLGDYAVFNMMIYAEPGEGKTPLLGSVIDCERMMPALLIDCDSGTLSIRKNENLKTIHLSEMAAQMTLKEKREISPWNCIELIYSWLRTGQHNFRTVMLDGGSEIEKHCEMECISYAINTRLTDGKNHDPELAELGDYRRIQSRMKRMYMRYRDIITVDGRRVNLIATAHESMKRDDTSGMMTIQPMFLGKGSPMITSVFDIVGRLAVVDTKEKKEVKCLVCKIVGKARGRDRSGGFKEGYIAEPTMLKVANSIWGPNEAL